MLSFVSRPLEGTAEVCEAGLETALWRGSAGYYLYIFPFTLAKGSISSVLFLGVPKNLLICDLTLVPLSPPLPSYFSPADHFHL